MTGNWLVRAAALVAAALLFSCSPAEEGEEAAEQVAALQRPNVVLIVADDLGYGDLGAYGSEVIATPHIDALAGAGVRLTDGHVSAAVCSPSRAGLMTGRYQSRFGYEYNPSFNFEDGPEAGLGLPVTETTLADVLQGAGYATGLVGKWHLGVLDDYHPLNRGFDEFYGVFGGGTSYIDSRLPGTHSWPAEGAPTERDPHIARSIIDGREPVDVPEYLTDVFAAKAVDFIDRHADGPFFLTLALTAPHTPIQATDRYVDRNLHIEAEGARIYAAMVSSVDDAVGDVVGALRERGLDGNTLVVFVSDNGCINYVPDVICTNGPLSGAKRYHLEGGIRVPFIVTWPDGLPGGRVYDEPVISLDILPTVTAAAGLPPRDVDGVDLLPHLRGAADKPPHEFLFWRSAPNAAVRWGDWKLWRVDLSGLALEEAMNAGGRLLPLVPYPPVSDFGQMTVLYDVAADVGEQENLADRHPEVVQRLEAELETWTAELAEPLWPSHRSTLDTLEGKTVQLYF